MQTPTQLATICIALLASLPLHAGVVERDFLAPGDGLLTYDDVNRREWLDLSFAYTSLDNIKLKMVPGEFLEDFKFATEEDVRNLNLSAGPSPYVESGVDELIDSLGFIFRGIGGGIGIAEFTLGQVAIGFKNGQPIFDDTNVVLLNVGGVLPPPGGVVIFGLSPGNINRPIFSGRSGRQYIVANVADYEEVAIGLPSDYFAWQLATNDTGPFWLYRNAVPEPTSIVLLTFGVIVVLSAGRKTRRIGF